MSLQVWCYECDDYVEGWDVLESIQDNESEEDILDVPADVSMNGSVEFKSSNIGAGKKFDSIHVKLI